MAEIINAERDSDNQHDPKPRKRKKKAKQKADQSDKDDDDFTGSSSESDAVSEHNDTDCVENINIEVCLSYFPSYTLFWNIFKARWQSSLENYSLREES